MSALSLIHSKSDGIFNDFGKFQKATRTLMRLANLDRALQVVSEDDRLVLLEDLQNIWTKAESYLNENMEACRGFTLEALSRLGTRFSTIYSKEIRVITSHDEMTKALKSFQKDTVSILVPPVRKSKRGNKGPTLLVNYDRLSQARDGLNNYSFVIKWTSSFELVCNQVYTAFSRCFQEGGGLPLCGYLTPGAAGCDFTRLRFEKATGQLVAFDTHACSSLKVPLIELAKRLKPDFSDAEPYLMISERVKGENIFDFAQTRYRQLSQEHKMKLFNRLSRLAILDIIMGNLDRLIQIYDFGSTAPYELQDFEANLGNVMVVWTERGEDPPLLFAIDNGIEPDLVFSSNHREKYNKFLANLFANKNWIDILANNLLLTMQTALTTQVDDVSEGNVIDLKNKFSMFAADLNTIGRKSFRQGIEEMAYCLQEHLIPGWESTREPHVKTYIQEQIPELLEAIQERIQLCKQALNSTEIIS